MTAATLTVTLSAPTGLPVTIGWTAIPGTAMAGADFLGRPAIPEDRIRLLDDGTVAFRLKRPWKGDVEQLLFELANFVARLAASWRPHG